MSGRRRRSNIGRNTVNARRLRSARDEESPTEHQARLSQTRDRYRAERERESSVEREVRRSWDRHRHRKQTARKSSARFTNPMEFPDNMLSINMKEEEETLTDIQNTINIKSENELQENYSELIQDIEDNLTEENLNPVYELNPVIETDIVVQAPPIEEENINSSLEIKTEDVQDPFENIQLVVKEETNINLKEVPSNPELSIIVPDKPVIEQAENVLNINIKEEQSDGMVTSDFPIFDDGSMDSDDAAALGNVEACLQDDMEIKCENDANFQDPQKEVAIPDIKMESDMTVTDTMLTPQITSNTVQETPKYEFIMKIPSDVMNDIDQMMTPCSENGMTSNSSLTCNSNDNEDCYNGDYDSYQHMAKTNEEIVEHNEMFQLNSITGNFLTLEQEARRMAENGFTCKKCPKYCSNKYRYKYHLSVHQTIENYANGRIKGSKTRKENQAKLLREMELHQSDPDESKTKESRKKNTEEVKYSCTCGKKFLRRSRMETCLRSHDYFESKNKCVPCVTCLKQFKNKQELSEHRKRSHRKKFPCKFCPTDYDTRKELFKHLQIHQKVQLMEYKVIEEVVKGKKKLKCFMCSKTWTDLSELKTHVMLEHKGPYLCPHCKNTFPKIIDFGNHMKSYHPDVEGQSVLDVLEAFSRLVQEWRCGECDLQFLEPDKLALHQIEKHSPELKAEPQFQCEDCRRVFISQKGLTSHRRIHHSVETTSETKLEELGIMCLECRTICKDINALTSHMRFHSPDRKYPCKFCDFRFATAEKRKAHAEIHTGDMKFVCFICEYQCSSENRLKQHKMSLKHANMKEYLLTGKPLVEESTSKEKVKKEDSVRKRKKVENHVSKGDSSYSSSSDSEEVSCEICGEKFPNEEKMLDHKQTHPFIEFPNDDKPTRIFFK